MVRHFAFHNGHPLWFLAQRQCGIGGAWRIVSDTYNRRFRPCVAYKLRHSRRKAHHKARQNGKTKYIDIAEIAEIRELPLAFRLGSYVLIELKSGKMLSLQPDNSKAFISTIQKLL